MEDIAAEDVGGTADEAADEYTPELDAILTIILDLAAEGALIE